MKDAPSAQPVQPQPGPLRFSLERALFTWLFTLGAGLVLTLVVMGVQALPSSFISEADGSTLGILIAIFGALVAIVGTLPLAFFISPGSHYEYLILPNVALLGLVVAGIRGWTRG